MRHAKLLLSLLVSVACGRQPAPHQAPDDATPQALTITATEYAYVLPSTPITAGLTTITLLNTGNELHHMQLVRLTEGKTVADLSAALNAGGPLPAWVEFEGGPNGALPGKTANATLILAPGRYAMYCRIPSPDGRQHFAKGMVAEMEVLPASATVAALPEGDLQVALFDYGFSLSATPTAGTHTFSVTNQAGQPHEVAVVRLDPGATMQPWHDWVAGRFKGPPPSLPISGITDIAPGAVQNFTATFVPGTYGLICFVVDAADHQSHVLHGMTSTFTVS